MLARQEARNASLIKDRRQEPGSNVTVKQPVPVLQEGRVVPYRLVDTKTDEPAEQKIELQPRHQPAFERAEKACSSISGAPDGRPSPE